MKKIRAHQLAKELNQTNTQLINIAQLLKIKISSHLSSLNDKDVVDIKNYLQNKGNQNDTIDLEEENNNDYVPEMNGLIRQKFQKLRTVDNFISLVNLVNTKIYKHPHLLAKKHLTYYAFVNKEKYTKFEIAKKSGGAREIYAPSKGLKYILQTLNVIFQALYKPQVSTHGFLQKRSVVTNAALHVNKNYVYNIDLENFFPSIHQARIWKRLQYPPFNLSGNKTEIANLISNLICYQFDRNLGQKNFLPQGAPTSPILSNIICYRLDKKIIELAKNYNVKYTRYADDMTFSSDHNVYQENSEFIQALEKIIKNENFCINSKKTRLQKRGYKQEVTGLIVNEKINVTRSYVKNLRALLHLVEKYGDEKAQNIFEKNNPEKNLFLVIQGKLQYLKMVKGFEDSTYMTLHKKMQNAYKTTEKSSNSKVAEESQSNKVAGKNTINDRHDPKELVSILRNFTTCNKPPCALKASVHSEDVYYEFNGYNDFINELKKTWGKIDKQLKNLSPRLHGKIYAFLFANDLGTEQRAKKNKDKSGWGDHQITFGWSSPELKEWCLDTSKNPKGNNPFEYQLEEEHYKEINGEPITCFFDVCMNVFKHEIEVRSDINQLHKIFLEQKKALVADFNFDIDSSLKGQDFYTDVHWIKAGINTIFSEIKRRKEHSHVEAFVKNETDEFIEIHIIQNGSNSNKTTSKLALEINDGGF